MISAPKLHRLAAYATVLVLSAAPAFAADLYGQRNTVERAINKLKQFRAVATRYDKRCYIYLGTTTVAALVIWLRP